MSRPCVEIFKKVYLVCLKAKLKHMYMILIVHLVRKLSTFIGRRPFTQWTNINWSTKYYHCNYFHLVTRLINTISILLQQFNYKKYYNSIVFIVMIFIVGIVGLPKCLCKKSKSNFFTSKYHKSTAVEAFGFQTYVAARTWQSVCSLVLIRAISSYTTCSDKMLFNCIIFSSGHLLS